MNHPGLLPAAFLSCLFVTLFSCSSLNKAMKNNGYDLYLLVGQSNMAGRGILEKEDTVVSNNVFALGANDTVIPAKEPLHYDKKNRGSGPGLAFGKAISKSYPDRKILLVPAAVGGTKISYWSPDNSHGLYNEAIRKTKVAMKYGTLKGIVWQQGESDSNSKDAPLYKQRLKELITNFRKDLGNKSLPVVVGGLGDFLRSKYYPIVNNALKETASEMEHVAFSEASRLGHIGDSLHFNSKAQRENGLNMAEAMLKIIK